MPVYKLSRFWLISHISTTTNEDLCMSTTKRDFSNNCFSPNWIEVDLEDVQRRQTVKEDRLESKQRKDLSTLLKELDEIKQDIEKVAEKQHRLANLIGFYRGEFAQ